jgi:hypothetical protein
MSSCPFLSIASILLVLSPALGQPEVSTAQPPLFQGIMVDAKGNTVGRFFPSYGGEGLPPYVVRQMGGTWVMIPVDLDTGFTGLEGPLAYAYQSVDCTGQAYFVVNSLFAASTTTTAGAIAPALGFTAIVPPATTPSIYFAGTPRSILNIKSYRVVGMGCQPSGPPEGLAIYVGPVQSVLVSSLGLTPPFGIK